MCMHHVLDEDEALTVTGMGIPTESVSEVIIITIVQLFRISSSLDAPFSYRGHT